MKKERFILSLIAILIGLAVAGVAFYLYQMTRVIPDTENKNTPKISPTPTPDSSLILEVDTPKDEEVVTRKTITVSGKTVPDATVIVSSETADEVATPAKNGNFSVTLTIGDGANVILITAIFPDGTEKKITKTVTYSTETF